MLESDNQYSKLRFLLTVVGLFLYVVDIWTDMVLALKYFGEQHYVWCGLTLTFVLLGTVVTQIFSFVWYWDDLNDVLVNPEGESNISGMSGCELGVLHVFGLGVFTRFYHLLKTGLEEVWTTRPDTPEREREVHHSLFCMATDLSMLKLFEAFLESVPQLLLQLCVVLGHDEHSFIQYLSVAFSCFNVAWALVDYRRCLRRSLPRVTEMPSGIPTAIYLLYKFCTITSLVLSFSILLILSPYSMAAVLVLWLLGTMWTHVLQTNFCTSTGLELVYRAVVGVILVFTFFNVKGQDTKTAMIVYYSIHVLMHFTALLTMSLLKPEMWTSAKFLTVSTLIMGLSTLGLVCLVLYYVLLHPRGKDPIADQVDGLGTETKSAGRQRKALQP